MKQAQVPSSEPSAMPGVPEQQGTLTPENPRPASTVISAESPGSQPITIPEILLEGDESEPPAPEQPPAKFTPATAVNPMPPEPVPTGLPQAYGTGRLTLMAPDPASLYAHWDLTADQQRQYAEKAADGRLWVQVHRETINGRPVVEFPAQPAPNHRFIPVEPGSATYVAELGYRPPDGSWKTIAASSQVRMPGWTPPVQQPVQFGTLRFENAAAPSRPPEASTPAGPKMPSHDFERQFPLPPPLRPRAFAARSGPEQGESVPDKAEPVSVDAASADQVNPGLLCVWPAAAGGWTEAQESALTELLGAAVCYRQGLGSAEITELLRARAPVSPGPGVTPELPSQVTGLPSSGLLTEAPAGQPGFWLSVNTELVLYGSTTPDAQVTIGGQPVPLRQDGSFSFRFALPDGYYSLPVVAISATGERRQAELDFSRHTVATDPVGTAPADPGLKPPLAPHWTQD